MMEIDENIIPPISKRSKLCNYQSQKANNSNIITSIVKTKIKTAANKKSIKYKTIKKYPFKTSGVNPNLSNKINFLSIWSPYSGSLLIAFSIKTTGCFQGNIKIVVKQRITPRIRQ